MHPGLGVDTARPGAIAITVVGTVGGLAGLLLMSTCTALVFGTCVQYGYHDLGLAMAISGGLLVVVGIIALMTEEATHPLPQPQVIYAVAPPAYPSPPQGPTCSACGQPLTWIAPTQQWYCSRCGRFR